MKAKTDTTRLSICPEKASRQETKTTEITVTLEILEPGTRKICNINIASSWNVIAPSVPSIVFLEPGHLCFPILCPTKDAAASPTPMEIIPA